MNFRFEPYCENCEFVEPVAIRNRLVIADTGERFGDKMTITCQHAKLCKRLHHHIEVAERAKNCSDGALQQMEMKVDDLDKFIEEFREKLKNCSDEAAKS